MIIQCVVLAIEGTDNSCPNDKRRGWCWLILKKGHGIWPCQSKFETLHCIAWIEGVKVNRPCFIQRRIFSCSARRRDLFDTASDGVVATVMLGVCDGPAWGHWILTSFTHGCRSAQHHNGGLPLVFSHSSALADRTLSRQKMDDRSSWPLNTTRVASCPCMTKEPPPRVQWPSSPLTLTGSDISIDPSFQSSHTGSFALSLLQTVVQTSFFCLLTVHWDGGIRQADAGQEVMGQRLCWSRLVARGW